MMNRLGHFAIHADDVERAKRFYERVFDWRCEGYAGAGTAEFVQIKGADGAVMGAVQARRFNPLGTDVLGFECSIAVEDVDAVTTAVEAAGGTMLMVKTAIPGVGWIVKFRDTEGNLCCAVAYDPSAA